MFNKQSLDNMFDELRDEYELEPDWEDIQRAAHLGVARSDAGVALGDLDSRVIPYIEQHSSQATGLELRRFRSPLHVRFLL